MTTGETPNRQIDVTEIHLTVMSDVTRKIRMSKLTLHHEGAFALD
jgi:hypothetical protein